MPIALYLITSLYSNNRKQRKEMDKIKDEKC